MVQYTNKFSIFFPTIMATPRVSVDTPFFQQIRARMDPETAAEVRSFQDFWMNGGARMEQEAYERERELEHNQLEAKLWWMETIRPTQIDRRHIFSAGGFC